MIERSFYKGDAASTALYSQCERYRYHLTRVWAPERERVNFVMLNPSKATEVHNDPTIERCERRARALGYGGVTITNLFALRETDPQAMKKARTPVGPENNTVLKKQALWSDIVIGAWGVHGTHRARHLEVTTLLAATGKPLCHLGLTKQGHPRHPLYVSYQTQPQPWLVTPR